MTKPIKIIGLSGPSSSGKSTLARLLRLLFPGSILVYQDDFYRPDNEIPSNEKGVLNWDCPEAFDLDLMAETLEDIHQTGQTPDRYISKEEQNKIGPDHVTKEDIEQAREIIKQAQLDTKYQYVFVDGIMLYHLNSPVASKFDVKFFLRASYEELKKRREARSGYVTIDGFWQDPPGYFDDIVYPSYVEYHKHLFKDNNVDSPLLSSEAQALDINLPSSGTTQMADILGWAINTLEREL